MLNNIYTVSYLLNDVFDAANKPNTKRKKSSKFQTKLVLFCKLPIIPPLGSTISFELKL